MRVNADARRKSKSGIQNTKAMEEAARTPLTLLETTLHWNHSCGVKRQETSTSTSGIKS